MRFRVITAPVAIMAAGVASPLQLHGRGAHLQGADLLSELLRPVQAHRQKNAKVRFVWDDFSFDAHDVNVKKGPVKFHSPLQAGGTWTTQKKLKKPGKYFLFCSASTKK